MKLRVHSEIQATGGDRQFSGVANQIRQENPFSDIAELALQIIDIGAVHVNNLRASMHRKPPPQRANFQSMPAQISAQVAILNPA
jgi:hypothetical protein